MILGYNVRYTMNPRTLIWFGAIVGSTVGSFIPGLWGAGLFSMSSVILSTVGGIFGIWLGFKLSHMI